MPRLTLINYEVLPEDPLLREIGGQLGFGGLSYLTGGPLRCAANAVNKLRPRPSGMVAPSNGRVVLTDTIDTAAQGARNRVVTTDKIWSTGQWKDGNLLLNKTAIREAAKETGQSVRQILYDTAYHEAFHGFVEKWTKPFFKKFGIDDIYLASQDAYEWGKGWGLWYRSAEALAEAYGRARGYLRAQWGWK